MRIIADTKALRTEFKRCASSFKSLTMAVAWCGGATRVEPYKSLARVRIKIQATIGIAFDQSHPDGIKWFMDRGADVRVAKNMTGTFHPKVYLFESGARWALIMGSANLTASAFRNNDEVCILVESGDKAAPDLASLKAAIAAWRDNPDSFKPTEGWLASYRECYRAARARRARARISDPVDVEISAPSRGSLLHYDWPTFYRSVSHELTKRKGAAAGYADVLQRAEELLPLPWRTSFFATLEQRRILGGIGSAGWLGHVAASGAVRKMFAKVGSPDHETIVRHVNAISRLPVPVPVGQLQRHLESMVALGPTMKVWSRLLCVAMPDRFPTIASESVRKKLKGPLSMTHRSLITPEGYSLAVHALQMSPWYRAPRPSAAREASIWGRRMAYVDALYY